MGRAILLMRKGAPYGNNNASKSHAKTASGAGNRPASLKDNIHAILHGSRKERENLVGQFFHLLDTPAFMKEIGLSGDFFEVKYGVISRHSKKDKDHNLSEKNWLDLCDAIARPFAIARHGEGYRLFTSVKTGNKFIAVGIDVKNIGEGIEVNSVSTVFGYNERERTREEIVYRSKKMTPEQTALLDGLNSLSLPPIQKSSLLLPNSLKKSIAAVQFFTAYGNLKTAVGKTGVLHG